MKICNCLDISLFDIITVKDTKYSLMMKEWRLIYAADFNKEIC